VAYGGACAAAGSSSSSGTGSGTGSGSRRSSRTGGRSQAAEEYQENHSPPPAPAHSSWAKNLMYIIMAQALDPRINNLLDAIRSQNIEDFDAIIATRPVIPGIYVNGQPLGNALLHAAIDTQNPHFVNGLIVTGVRAHPYDRGQLLVRVAMNVDGPNNAVEMARLLIDAGASVNSNGMAQPPIFIAAVYGRFDLFRYLILERGADPAVVVHGRNVLDAIRLIHHGSEDGKKDCAALILSLIPEIRYTSPVFGTIVPRPEHFGDTIPEFMERVRRIFPERAALARGPAVLAYAAAAAAARRAGGRRRKSKSKKTHRRRGRGQKHKTRRRRF